MKFCFNGTFFSSSQAAGVDCEKEMNIFSRGVFETLRTYHEDFIFARKEHLSRLWHSAKMLSIPCSETQKKTILRSLDQLVAFNRISKTNLRIKIALFPKKFWIETQKLIPPSASIYTSGVAMTETTFDRPFAMAKYTTPAYQKFLTKQGAAFETIFFDTAGYVREGNISNIFILLDGKIFTPQKTSSKESHEKKPYR
jgi:branched-subunit amino acid aminotransferase/4-amino-4-deoxychorismate lyase